MNTHSATDATSQGAVLRSEHAIRRPSLAESVIAIARAATRGERLRKLAEAVRSLYVDPPAVVAWLQDRDGGVSEGVWLGADGQAGTFALEEAAEPSAGDATEPNRPHRFPSVRVGDGPDSWRRLLDRLLRHPEPERAVRSAAAKPVLLGHAVRGGRTVAVVVLEEDLPDASGAVGEHAIFASPDPSAASSTSAACPTGDRTAPAKSALEQHCDLLAEITLAAETARPDAHATSQPVDWFGAEPSEDGRLPLPPEAALEALAEFAAGAGHEINNPVANIVGRAERLLREEKDPGRRQLLAAIAGQSWRIRDMIGDLMLFGRPPKPRLQPVSLYEAVRQAVDRLRDEPFAAKAVFVVRPPGDMLPHAARVPSSVQRSNGAAAPHADGAETLEGRVPVASSSDCGPTPAASDDSIVPVDPAQLAVVLHELLRNACEAAPEGPVTVAVVPDRGVVTVSVHTPGVTMSASEWRRMFFPFYSARQAGRGLGFGLCKVWRIVNQHGGHIDVSTGPAGTTFAVRWPRGRATAKRTE